MRWHIPLFPTCEHSGWTGGSAGSASIVYPSADGDCLQSIRQKVFYEAVNDMRALLALERLIGKRETRRFVTDFFGEVNFERVLGTPDTLLAFREALNQKIAENSK